MPDSVFHVPATGIDGAHDYFNRVWQTAVAPAAPSQTALVSASSLPAAPAVWTPSSGGFTLGVAGLAVYAQSQSGHVCQSQVGVLCWKLSTPRALSMVCSGAQAGNVTAIGIDPHGNLVTETEACNGATVVNFSIPVEYIVSLAVPTKAAAETISVGTGSKIWMPYAAADADSELRVYVDAVGDGAHFAKGTNGTIDAANATYLPNSAPDGTKLYRVLYQSVS